MKLTCYVNDREFKDDKVIDNSSKVVFILSSASKKNDVQIQSACVTISEAKTSHCSLALMDCAFRYYADKDTKGRKLEIFPALILKEYPQTGCIRVAINLIKNDSSSYQALRWDKWNFEFYVTGMKK